jgi:hypothetical protein
MKAFTTLAITLCFAATSSYAAQHYTGKLMDADCYNSNKVATHENGHKTYHDITKTCAPTESTTTFAIRITGSPYGGDVGNTIKLDDAGNALVMSELKSGVLKKDSDGDVHIRARGKLMGETLTNASISPRHGKAVGQVTAHS